MDVCMNVWMDGWVGGWYLQYGVCTYRAWCTTHPPYIRIVFRICLSVSLRDIHRPGSGLIWSGRPAISHSYTQTHTGQGRAGQAHSILCTYILANYCTIVWYR